MFEFMFVGLLILALVVVGALAGYVGFRLFQR
jgi:hypothetical protein